MKRWGVAVGVLVAIDAALRLHGHADGTARIGSMLVPGLHLAAVPAPSGAGLGLGALAWAGVCLALALLAAGSYLLTAALLDVRACAVFRLGAAAAALVVLTCSLDLAEGWWAGQSLDLLAWRPDSAAARLFRPADLLLPPGLVALGLAWLWLVLKVPADRGP